MSKKIEHVYRVPADHSIASLLKEGEKMTVTMRRIKDEEGSDDILFTEESAEQVDERPAPRAAVPQSEPKRRARTPAELIRQRREAAATR